MATIGTKNSANNATINDDRAYLLQASQFQYTPSENEEVYEVGIYSNSSNSGKSATVSVRDVTGGVAEAISLSDTIVNGSSGGQWDIITLPTPLQLVAGNTYAVSVLINIGDWSGRKENSAWASDKSSKLSGQSSVPVNFLAGSDDISGYSFYAETRASTVQASPTLHTLILEDGSSNPVVCESTDFALGVTAYKNKGLSGEETATSVVSITNTNTSAPQYHCEFPTGDPVPLVDTISFDYDDTVGDIKSVTGAMPLATGTFTGTTC